MQKESANKARRGNGQVSRVCVHFGAVFPVQPRKKGGTTWQESPVCVENIEGNASYGVEA